MTEFFTLALNNPDARSRMDHGWRLPPMDCLHELQLRELDLSHSMNDAARYLVGIHDPIEQQAAALFLVRHFQFVELTIMGIASEAELLWRLGVAVREEYVSQQIEKYQEIVNEYRELYKPLIKEAASDKKEYGKPVPRLSKPLAGQQRLKIGLEENGPSPDLDSAR